MVFLYRSRAARVPSSHEAILDGAPDAMLTVAEDGTIRSVNRKVTELFGYERAELVGRPIETLVPDHVRPKHPGLRQGFFAEGVNRRMGAVGHRGELRGRRKDGSELPVDISLSLVTIGRERLVLAAVRDVSQDLEARERLEKILDGTPDAILKVTEEGKIRFANRMAAEVFGYQASELIGQPVEILVPQRIRAGHPGLRAAFMAGGVNRRMGAIGHRGELRGVRKDGSEFPVDISLSIVRLGSENIVLAAVRDVTQDLEARERLQQILDTSPVGVAISVDSTVRFANPRFSELLGIGVGDSMAGVYRDVKDRERLLERLKTERVVRDYEFRALGAGAERKLLVTLLRTTFEGEDAMLGWVVDVTRLKETESQLQQSNFLADTALDLTRAGYWRIDFSIPDYYFASDRVQQIFGEQGDPDGRLHLVDQWHSRITAVDPAAGEATSEKFYGTIEGRYAKYDATYPYRRPNDGRVIWVHALATLERHADGKPSKMYGVVQDITAQREAEQALHESEALLEAAAKGANLGLWEVDATKGEIIANDILESQLGYPPGGLRVSGDKWAAVRGGLAAWPEYLHPDDRPRTLELIEQHLSGRSDIYRAEHRVRGPDGNYTWVLSVGSTRERDASGRSTHVNGVHINISEMKALQAELEKARDAAEVASQAKADFLANMSHEIRTPMNAIIGLSHLALLTELDRKQRDYLQKIESSGKHLLGVINDILDFSKIEAGKLTVETVDFHLDRVLENVVALVTDKALQKGLELTVDVDPRVPRSLRGDPLRISQIIINYANNAVKFTDKGDIVIRVRVLEDGGDDLAMRFEVQDSGIGLTPEQKAKLFQSFQQADASTSRKYGGTGLGLAICKRLAELMDGEVGVDSVVGSGSTFWFTVPLGRGSAPSRQLVPQPDLRNRRVLVVDDSANAREVLTGMLGQMTFRVDQVPSGEDALDKVAAADAAGDPYDVVFLDWSMPGGIDGIETARRLESQPLKAPPRRVMVTAYGRGEVMQEATGAGILAALVKPVSPSMLFDTVMEVLGGTPQQEARSSRELAALPDLDALRGIRVLLVEDNELNQQVASELLRTVGIEVEVAGNGREAVDRVARDAWDVVLMDMQMPVMDGEQATRIIRQNFRAERLPVLAMTANAMEADRERCLAAGMNDHIAKPIDPADLFGKLLRWLPASARHAGGATPAAAPAKPPQQAPAAFDLGGVAGLDVGPALARMLNKRAMYEDMVRKFAWGESASAATTISSQLEAGAVDDARRAAHTLKGLAAMIGAEELRSRAAVLEDAIRHAKAPKDQHAALQRMAEELGRLVQAVRAVVPAPEDGAPVDPAEAVAALPEDELGSLREALEEGDFERIEELATALQDAHAVAARALLDRCAAFDRQGLAELLDS